MQQKALHLQSKDLGSNLSTVKIYDLILKITLRVLISYYCFNLSYQLPCYFEGSNEAVNFKNSR